MSNRTGSIWCVSHYQSLRLGLGLYLREWLRPHPSEVTLEVGHDK